MSYIPIIKVWCYFGIWELASSLSLLWILTEQSLSRYIESLYRVEDGLKLGLQLKMFLFQSSLQASRGWVQRDDTFMDAFQNQKYVIHYEKGVINIKGLCWISFLFRYFPAIYTHCYDTSGTRLFAAGGPLQCGLKVWGGCYSLRLPFRFTWNALNILSWCYLPDLDCWNAYLGSLFVWFLSTFNCCIKQTLFPPYHDSHASQGNYIGLWQWGDNLKSHCDVF